MHRPDHVPTAVDRPCPVCPWRVDGPPTWRRHAANAALKGHPYPCRTPQLREQMCAGWLATVGADHPDVADAIGFGVPVGALQPAGDWPPLHPDAAALEAAVPDRPAVDPLIEALTARRKAEGLTRADIADVCGLSVDTVAKIEQGSVPIRLPELHGYAAAVRWQVLLDWAPD